MEPAKINWQTLDSVFVRDDTFENINAPQWVDFLAPDDASSLDDEAWFCKPDCKHPKTAQDFLKSTPTSKLLGSVAVSKIIALGDWSRIREVNLKRRAPQPPPQDQDGENQNPNLATPLSHQIKPEKASIKSSSERGRVLEDEVFSEIPLHSDENPKLMSVLPGKDVFAGRDLLGKITDFCNELKKMASITRANKKDRDEDDCEAWNNKLLMETNANKQQCVLGDRGLQKTNDKETRDRKPFHELSKESCEAGVRRSPLKDKLRKKIMRGVDDAENIPLSLDLKKAKACKTVEESLQGTIRTSPPTPQCFSATREPVKCNLSKTPKSRLKEREPFQEIQLKQVLAKEQLEEKSGNGRRSPLLPNPVVNVAKEGRTLDVFWFFKPCAHSSTEF